MNDIGITYISGNTSRTQCTLHSFNYFQNNGDFSRRKPISGYFTVENMASNFLSRSSIPPTAATLSAGFLGLGALHFLAPFQLCEFFGVPSHSPSGLPKTGPLPFIYANGGREVMLGIALWIMGRQRNREGINALLYGMSVCMPMERD